MTNTIERTVKGVLGEKLGMTQVWDENNRVVPVTVVKAGPCVVTQVRDGDTDGYDAVQIAFGEIDPRKVNKPLKGHFAKAGVTPRRHLVELRTADAGEYTLGQEITAEVFEAGPGRRRDRHHQGQGLRRCHEASRLPRRRRRPTAPTATTASPARSAAAPPRAASSRACAWPAAWAASVRPPRTSPSTPSTPSKGLLLIKGAVPGPNGGLVLVRTAAKGACRRHDTGTTVDVLTPTARTTGTVELPAEIFDVQVNIPLIHQVVVAQLAAARQGTHSTKTRGEVRGGGRKPYRQKGTGRARQGSTRAPQFAGGGVVHGPTPRDYAQRTPEEDEGRRPARCPLRPGPQRPRPRRRRRSSTATCRRPRRRGRGCSAADRAQERARRRRARRRGRRGRACATSSGVHLLVADQLNTYDVLGADDVVFTQGALRRVPRRPGQRGRQGRDASERGRR